MKDRKTAIISGLVLAGLVLVGGWLKYGEKKKGEVKAEKYFGDQVESFCVNKICLIKKTDGWWMMGAEAEEPADGELAESMLKRLET